MMFGKNSQIAFVLCASLLSFGCDDDKDKKSSSPAPQPIRAEIGGKSNEGGAVKVSYRSNVTGARFKCVAEPQGAPAGEWEDCPAEGELVTGLPGQRVTFKVKAVSPSGVESEPVITSVIIPGEQPPAPGPGPAPAPGTNTNGSVGTDTGTDTSASAAATVILGKDQLSEALQQSSVTLNFGIRNGQGSLEQYRFECLASGETDWRRCNGSGEHTLSNLEDGKTYTLRVRAVHISSGAIASEDSAEIKVQRPRLAVAGEQQLRDAKTGSVRVSFEQNQIAGLAVQCQIDQQPATACNGGVDVNVGSLAPGQHTLSITAGQMSPIVIPFCTNTCDAGEEPQVPAEPSKRQILVGDTIHFVVPTDMHVTTYATTQTASARINFIQIMNDPYYVGNYNCTGPFDKRIDVDGGEYCNVTPDGALFDWLTDKTVARNHVEVATNPEVVKKYPEEHDRIVINQFDSQYEFYYNRSRFDHLCRHVAETITVTPEPIDVFEGFWRGREVAARFVSCYGPLAGTGSDLWFDQGTFAGWWIGTFFVTKEISGLPTADCLRGYNPRAINLAQADYEHCRVYHQPQLIEVTIMTRRQFAQPAHFARWAQDLTVNHMTQDRP